MHPRLKVVHVNTSHHGGAANAAIRLHDGLMKCNIESSFLCLTASDPERSIFKYPDVGPAGLTSKVLQRLGWKIDKTIRHKKLLKSLGGNFEVFSFPETPYRLEDHPLVRAADVVNLHWVADFLDYPSFFEKINKPVVWTLHDMNSFMGGFHYTTDREGNQDNESLLSLDRQLQAQKKSVLDKALPLHFVTPSKWLGEELSKIDYAAPHTIHHIPNGLDLDVFRRRDRLFSRSLFDLPPEKKILVFIAPSLKTTRKGGDLLLTALEKLSDRDDILCVAVGGKTKAFEAENIIQLGPIHDERLISAVLSAADAMVLPSRQDNLPNVMLESLACGTPVISFNEGGMKDVVVDGETGFKAESLNPEGLLQAIRKGLSHDFNREHIRSFAEKNFALEVQADAYKKLYNQLLR